MSAKASRIECSKCGEPADVAAVKCPRCSSRVIKVCGACGFKNSVAKKYCDACGEPQISPEQSSKDAQASKPGPAVTTLPAADKPAPTIAPAQTKPPQEKPREQKKENKPAPETSSARLDIPKTFILNPVPMKPAHSQPPPASSASAKPAPASPASRLPEGKERGPARRLSDSSALFASVLLLAGAAIYGYLWNLGRTPKALVEKTAREYLSALRAGNYASAYSMLSSEAKKNCSIEEFKSSQDSRPWSFGKLEVGTLEKDGALVRYTLDSSDQESTQDWLRFVREGGRWTRAYWWNLSRKIEENPGQGLEAAQAAVRIDPYDSLARSYLCEAQYSRGDITAAERECRTTLDLAVKYPGLDDAGLRHTHAILGDIYKNHLSRYTEAIAHFDFLLASPDATPAQLCDLRLARAETRYLAQDYPDAIADFEEADKLCLGPDKQALAKRSLRVLSGEAGPEAVAFVKNYRMADGDTTLEWRKKALTQLAGQAGYSAAASEINRAESWSPEHLDGSLYKVSVRNKETEILTAQVDLWNQKVKVDIHVQ